MHTRNKDTAILTRKLIVICYTRILACWFQLEFTGMRPLFCDLVLMRKNFFRSKNQSLIDLFDSKFGRPIFNAIMSKKTFQYITQVIRFDDVLSRREQNSPDKFAPTRKLFEKWTELLPIYYNPSECVTVDEQLLGFRGWNKILDVCLRWNMLYMENSAIFREIRWCSSLRKKKNKANVWY